MILRAPLRGLATPIALAVILSVIFSVSADAATVTIAWEPSPDETVIGYQVYVGTSSGSYTETFDVGLATSFSYNPSDAAVYYFAVAVYAAGPVLGPRSSEVSTAHRCSDLLVFLVGQPCTVNPQRPQRWRQPYSRDYCSDAPEQLLHRSTVRDARRQGDP